MKKRMFSLFTALAFCLTLLPAPVMAAELEEVGLCPHHRKHIAECGYIPPTEGAPCQHEHTEDCYAMVTNCLHVHDAGCYSTGALPAEGEDETADACQHECGKETGCVISVLDCQHVHDETCGYVEADPGKPCGYVCKVCPVQAMIDELPDKGEITQNNAEEVSAQLDAIDTAKLSLTDEELDALDFARYQAVIDALLALEGLDGAEEPMLLAEEVRYLTCDANGQNWEEKTCGAYTEVTAETTTWNNGWYVVNGEVTISDRITVNGDVHLILTDQCSLNAVQGIQVKDSDSLTIYAQSKGDGMGKLTANGPGCCAGIGGSDRQSGGTITICGGEITAKAFASNGDPAGIGGGGFGGGGTVVINGGVISANGSLKGIGCGSNTTAGSITINGGSVTANGIGTGGYGARVDTKINGGLVVCTDTGNGGINAGNESTWVGVIFKEAGSGQVYGEKYTLTEDLVIPRWTTLTVPEGTTLEVAAGVTLVNNGTIVDNGDITNHGTIGNYGTVSGNTPTNEGSGRTDSAPAISITFQDEQGKTITSQEYGKPVTITAMARQKAQANAVLLANDLADGTANFYLDNGGGPILLNEQPLGVTGGESGVITAALTLVLDSTDWRMGGNTIRVDFGPYSNLYLLGGSESAWLTVTPQVVNDFPEAGLCLNDGSISVEKRDEDTIFVAQGTTGYPIAKDVPFRVTGGAEMTANTITVTGADAHIILDNVNQGGSGWMPAPLTIEPRYDWDANTKTISNVTLTLEGNNALAASGDCSQGIAIRENCTLTIEGPGSLKIGNEQTYVGIGIGEMHEFGSVVINGGTLDITAQSVAVGAEMMMIHDEEDTPSITINGGVVKTNVQDGWGVGIGTRHAMEGGVDIAITGGSVELSGDGNKISASGEMYDPPDMPAPGSVTITGGSIIGVPAENGISPAPVDENGDILVPVTVQTGKNGAAVDDLAIDNTSYGPPAWTDAAGNLTLYLPVGTYTGMAIIGGELQTIKATASLDGPGTNSMTDTDIHVETPEGKKPEIKSDGSIELPGRSTVTKGSTSITFPTEGGTVMPNITDDTIKASGGSVIKTESGPEITLGDEGGTVGGNGSVTVPAGGSVQVGSNPAITLPDGGAAAKDGKVIGNKVQIGDTTVTGNGTTVNPDGNVTVPSNGTVKTGSGPEITLPGGGTADKDGNVTVSGSGTVQVGSTTITLPTGGGTIKPNEDGGVIVPVGSKVQTGSGETIEVPTGGIITSSGEVKKFFTVTFDSQSGSAVSSQIVTEDSKAVKPANPTKGGYIFVGWYTEAACTTAWNFDTAVTGDLTLYAKWTAEQKPPAPVVSYTVSFDSQGGSTVSSQTVNAGEKAAKPADPTRKDYIFGGWYRDAACTTVWNFDADTVTSNLTLYAKWTAKPSSDTPGSNTPSGGSHGGGGSYTPPTYPPTVEQPSKGGSVSVIPGRPSVGDKVTIQPKPDIGYEVDQVTVTDKNGKPVSVTKKTDGTYTFTQPYGKVNIEVSYRPVEVYWNNPHSDVSEAAWYFDAVRFVSVNGLMNGYGDGRFGPDDNLSRAQLAQILYNHAGRPVVTDASPFTDVANGEWYVNATTWAAAQGIVGGYGNGLFGPNNNITREQLAVMLWRYAGSPVATNKELHFNDADEASSYALEALRWAVENGILNGYGDGRLGPKGQATRAQVAQILKNFLEEKQQETKG